MKIKFMQDFGEYKQGQIIEVTEAEAEDHHQAGRAYPYLGEPMSKAAPEVKSKKPAKK